jgi:hypothetical protein
MRRITLKLNNVLFNQQGLGTVELVVLVVVLIGLALMFRRQITVIMTEILDNIDTDAITIQSILTKPIWML